MAKLSVKIEAVTKGLSAKLTSARSAFKKFGSSIKNIGLGTFGFATAIGTAVFAVAKMGGKLEKTKIAMEAFLGSSEKAKQLISDLRKFADVTPFDTTSMLEAGRVIASVQSDVTKILPTMRMLGDISSGSGKNINELAQLYAKMMRNQKIDQRDLNQLYDAGVMSQKKLADTIGINESKMRSHTRAGKVGFEDIERAMKSATSEGGKFFGLIEKQSQTFLGRISTLQGKLQNLFTDIGGPLQKSMTSITDTLIDWTDQAKTLNGPIGTLTRGLQGIADILESTRKGGSLAKTVGLEDYGVGDVATDMIKDIGKGQSNDDFLSPLRSVAKLWFEGMAGGLGMLGFGSEAIGQKAGLTGGTGMSQAESDRLDLQERQTVAAEQTASNTAKGSYN